jgi:hypothetical protein
LLRAPNSKHKRRTHYWKPLRSKAKNSFVIVIFYQAQTPPPSPGQFQTGSQKLDYDADIAPNLFHNWTIRMETEDNDYLKNRPITQK